MTATATKVPYIHLRHPELGGLEYGPDKDEAIVFGPRAGMPFGEAWIPEDHPLLADLLTAHPEVQIVRDTGPIVMWACPLHPNSTFKTQTGLVAHMAKDGHGAEDFAELALSATPDADGAPGPSDAGTDDGGIHRSPTSNVVQSEPPPPPTSAPQRR